MPNFLSIESQMSPAWATYHWRQAPDAPDCVDAGGATVLTLVVVVVFGGSVVTGGAPLLPATGATQYEVLAHRLEQLLSTCGFHARNWSNVMLKFIEIM